MRKSLIAPDVVWRLRNANGSIDVPAQLPGTAHQALLAAGVLSGDPMYRQNERTWSWVALEDWTFEGTFKLHESEARGAAALHFDAIDTAATIRLNGQSIGHTASAFTRHALPVPRGALRGGVTAADSNRLTVTIHSALAYGREQQAAYPYVVPHTRYYNVWSDDDRREGGRSSRRNFVRKPASDFGWDWGPSFIPSGLYGAVTLRSRPVHRSLADVAVAQRHHADGSVGIHVAGWLEEDETPSAPPDGTPSAGGTPAAGAAGSGLGVLVRLCLGSCASAAAAYRWSGVAPLGSSPTCPHAAATTAVGLARAAAADAAAPPTLLVRSPSLWWPRGHGEPSLYELHASLCDLQPQHAPADGGDGDGVTPRLGLRACAVADGPDSDASTGLTTITKRIGLRTVELVQDAALPPAAGLPNGTSFYFRVNGRPIFAKGANAIPSHIFATEETEERWRWLLMRAADAHMNMVRVWGGGRYQSDAFYRLCDELGLMVGATPPHSLCE